MRSGSSTPNSFSPISGLNEIVNNYYKGDTLASLEFLFQKQQDFDADKCQPHIKHLDDYEREEERAEYEIGRPFNPATDKPESCEYLRRLEDIRSEYFEDYLSNLVFTVFKRSGSSGAIEYDAQHYIQPTLISNEDDSVTELADLQLVTNEHDYSESAKARAREQLPYVIKRLHNLSRYCGIHMLSMIAAYQVAKEENIRKQSAGSTMLLKKNAVIAKGVYKCNKDGTIGSKIEVANKNKRAADMFDWLDGTSTLYPAYREDYLNFVLYCKMLNVDFHNDDFRKYDDKFVDSLVCTTLTPNKQYNQIVFDAIRDSGLEAPVTAVDVYLETMLTFSDLCTCNEDLKRVIRNHTSAMSKAYFDLATQLHFYQTVALYKGNVPVTSKYAWHEGFLHYDGELVILDTSLVSNVTFQFPKFIISELGFCVHVSTENVLDIMTLQVAVESMRDKFINHNADEIATWEFFS